MKISSLLSGLALLAIGLCAPAEEVRSLDAVKFSLPPLRSPYVPLSSQKCPADNLIRSATSLNPKESAYVQARNKIASANLAKWLQSTGAGFVTTGKLPVIAMAFSGGGVRAQLTGAGVRQAFDARDSRRAIAGLYQATSYETGLSGGSWLLGSISGNDYASVSKLSNSLWQRTLMDGLLFPGNFLTLFPDAAITSDIAQKQKAGFRTTIVDFWGRLQGYTYLPGVDGGVAELLSDVASTSNFTAHNVPFPIITALGVAEDATMCEAVLDSTQFEFSPYEFGSWDKSVKAFTPTKYLGTKLLNGKPSSKTSCVTRFDNLGFVMGTSSNVFPAGICPLIESVPLGDVAPVLPPLEILLSQVHNVTTSDAQAIYPNPFYKLAGVNSKYSSNSQLGLADGGTGGQNDPIWPLLHRPGVDVVFVSDNSADTSDNYPDGRELHQTYVQAQAEGLTRMPFIPENTTFIETGLDRRPAFFGCNTPKTLTLVWLPNTNYTFNSGQSTFRLQYSKADTAAMIANGNAVANYNGKEGWATCVACAVMKKTASKLPAVCTQCFADYCYN